MKSDEINQIFGIKESYQLPDVLMAKLLKCDMVPIYSRFMELGESLDHDWFTQYFEEEHSNKSKMAQDFTPQEVCDLLAHVVGEGSLVADVCAGTGGLTIGMWRKNPEAKFVCYEYSSRALPLLLFNLAVRNISARVCRCDLLTGEEFQYYEVVPSDTYGKVRQLTEWPDIKVDCVVSNPPYSMKYDAKKDARFPQYKDILPTNFADFVFMAFALSILKEDGKAGFILPHGVLFRTGKEQKFRQMLIDNNIVHSVIGLPDKMFMNTDIPTLIMGLQKNRTQQSVFFIDAKDEAKHVGRMNIFEAEHLNKIIEVYDKREDVDKFAFLANKNDLVKNNYSFQISRYVDTYEAPEAPDFIALLKELGETEVQIGIEKAQLLKMLNEMDLRTPETTKEHRQALKEYAETLIESTMKYLEEVRNLGW